MIATSFLIRVCVPIILFGAFTDFLLKSFVMDYLRSIPEKTIRITSFFNISEVWNYGVSFGMFRAGDPSGVIMLQLVAICIVAFLIYLMVKSESKLEACGMAMIIGGALGNLWDRFYYHAVYDFLDLHFLGIHFWTFNPADVYITLGAMVLIYDQIKKLALKKPIKS